MTLNDRQNEFNDNNMSLCENKCNFTNYNTSTKKSVCMCEIKSKIYTISEILESKESVSKDFNTENTTSSSISSVNIMKCYNTLFSKYGLLKNIGNYLLIFIIVIFSLSSIYFYKVGYTMLENEIKQILSMNEKAEEKNSIYKYDKKKDKDKDKKKKKNSKKNKKSTNIGNPSRKSLKKKIEEIDSINTCKNMNNKSFSKLDLKCVLKNKNKNKNRNKKKNTYKAKEKIIEFKYTSINYTDYELNFLSYKKALEIDKRSYGQYYISLLRVKHPILFSFIPNKDYNTMIIKIDIFLIFFAVLYAMNALFFNESTIHQIYEDGGVYNYSYFLPKTFLAFLLSYIVITIIKIIFLSEKNIIQIKKQETRNQASGKVDKVKKCLIIKYITFFISGVLFLVLFWYYLSSFCAVYQNSQIFLIINTFLSFVFSLIYPFFIIIFPVIIRKFSLNDSNRQLLYKINHYIQIII